MSIQINDINAIDDDRNFSASGIATVGSGASTITINGSNSIVNVGTGITLSGSDGSISIAGTIYASSLNVPIQVSSFSPAIGATGVSVDTNIILTFNQTVGFGTTGFIELKVGSATTGTLNETIYPVNATLTNGGTVLKLNNSSFPNATNEIFPVMSSGFVVANGSDFAGINTVGSATTYSFTTKPVVLGDAFGGGYLICQSGGTRWVVAPLSAEVITSWHNRCAAATCAQTVSGCTGWFIPNCAQMKNPGYTCRTYWDFVSTTVPTSFYWTDTLAPYNPGTGTVAWCFNFNNNTTYGYFLSNSLRVRAFRCVTY